MKIKKNLSLTQLIAMLSMLIIALSIGYYLVIFIPRNKQKELEIYKNCDDEASIKARKLLESKIDVAIKSKQSNISEIELWKASLEKGLFLKDDYNSYYENCLRRNGIKY